MQTNLALRQGERLVVLADEPLQMAAELLRAEARRLGAAETVALRLSSPGGGQGLVVVPGRLVQAVEAADLVVSLQSQLALAHESPIYRAARAAFAGSASGRWGSLAQVDDEMLSRELTGDVRAIAAGAEAVAAPMRQAAGVRIVTPAGTDLELAFGHRPVHVETGLLHAPGSYGNLPAGEAYLAPLEESAQGRLVVDRCLGDIPLDQPVTLIFQGGRVTSAEGGTALPELHRRLGADPWAWTVGEFGIGANPYVRPRGRVAVDEKALGTIHIALGANQAFGGSNPATTHYDCVVADPKLTWL